MLIAYWCLIFVLTHIPLDKMPELPGQSDKLAHLLSYSGLGFLLTCRLRLAAISGIKLAAMVVGIAALYGVADELLQIPVNRYADVRDWCADVAGSIIGAIAFFAIARTTRRWRDRRSAPLSRRG